MSTTPVAGQESNASAVVEVAIAKQHSMSETWVTRLAIVACIGIFLGLAAKDDYRSWETLAKFGCLPATAIRNGGYWALVTCVFVHFALWHVAFNAYWLWVLGSRLERTIGSLRFLVFYIAAAFVSSSFQLALSDSTGIGASGVVYAIFGFMWLTRHRHPLFREVLDAQTIQIFLIWLVGCVAATHFNVWAVGNAAHVSGLLFGGAVAGAFVLHAKPRLVLCGLVALIALAMVSLAWCPWSATWLGAEAYRTHAAKRYDAALERYTQLIHLDARNEWAYRNRSRVYQALGRHEDARADQDTARKLKTGRVRL